MIAVGQKAGVNNKTGSADTFLGYLARPTAAGFSNATALGFDALVTASNSIVLGNANITKLSAKVALTVTSDRRLKKDIAPLGSELGLSFVEKLQPVSYRFNNGDETQRMGFIAQDLEAALPAKAMGTIECRRIPA